MGLCTWNNYQEWGVPLERRSTKNAVSIAVTQTTTGWVGHLAAFLCGVLYVPSAFYILFDSAERLIHPTEVGYLLGLIPVSITFLTGTVLFIFATRLRRRTANPSPLLVSYRADYLIGMLTDGGVLVSFVLASILVGLGLAGIGDRIDPAVALVIALYMLWVGVSLVRHNFRALMDLPLPEHEQMTITRVLAHHYDSYDVVGTVYSRVSGKRRFVEIELGFDGEKTVEHVHALSRHMERDLAAEVPDLHFRTVPAWRSSPTSSFRSLVVRAGAAPRRRLERPRRRR